jgi:hypothetical protein
MGKTKPEQTQITDPQGDKAAFLANLFAAWMEDALIRPARLQEAMQGAVASYDQIPAWVGKESSMVRDLYILLASVPDVGLRIAASLQRASIVATAGSLGQEQLLDAIILPSFLLGMLTAAGLMRTTDVP